MRLISKDYEKTAEIEIRIILDNVYFIW